MKPPSHSATKHGDMVCGQGIDAVRCVSCVQLEKVRLDSEAAQRRMEAEAAQARVAVAQAESMYKSERAQWVTSLDAQKFEVSSTA